MPYQDTAVSSESRCLGRSLAKVRDHQESSLALNGAKSDLISSIWLLFEEHGTAGWDGEGAAPLHEDVAHQAIALIRALPEHLPLPEVGVDPDGAISFDWMYARHRAFSVSINATNRIACAWLDGTDRGHAVARFDGDSLPKVLLERLTALVSSGADLRVA